MTELLQKKNITLPYNILPEVSIVELYTCVVVAAGCESRRPPPEIKGSERQCQ